MSPFIDISHMTDLLKSLLLGLGLSCLSLSALSNDNAAASTLYFHNPEANINDFRTLTTLFDEYLADHSRYRFRPVEDKKRFEELMKKKDGIGVFILSSWHHLSWTTQQDLMKSFKPLLVGIIDGGITYTKVITTKKSIDDLAQLEGRRIASAGGREHTLETLENITEKQAVPVSEPFDVLIVPKDIDALMSVLFGMAQGALTSRHSLKNLAELNPKKYQQLNQHAESTAIMLPVISTYAPLTEETVTLLQALEKMGESDKGKKALGLLGLNGWKKLTKTDLDQLTSVEER